MCVFYPVEVKMIFRLSCSLIDSAFKADLHEESGDISENGFDLSSLRANSYGKPDRYLEPEWVTQSHSCMFIGHSLAMVL